MLWAHRAAAMQGKSIVPDHEITGFPRMCLKRVVGFDMPPKVVQQMVALSIGKAHDSSVGPPPEIERLLAGDRVTHHERVDGTRSVGIRIGRVKTRAQPT